MDKTTRGLIKELGRKTVVSCGLFLVLFGVLYLIEWLVPAIRGQLLQWDSAAFIVGIPASIVGVAYVLTIKNPQNYTGFYGGILMALLLSCQFYLQGNYDLVCLQMLVFVPFMIKSIIEWKGKQTRLKTGLAKEEKAHGTERGDKQTGLKTGLAKEGQAHSIEQAKPQAKMAEGEQAHGTEADKQTTTESDAPFVPQYLHGRALVWTLIVALLIVVVDYLLATLFIQHDAWNEHILLKLCSGMMIASSTLANFWLIYQKIDAWIWWVVYSASGIALYILINNMFSLLLFCVFLVVNGSAMIAWMRMGKAADNKK